MWAVVPLKSPHRAKSRLAAVLDTAQRRELMFALAERAIHALQATRGIERIVIVTASEEIIEFAARLGADTIRQDNETGTAGALAFAQRELVMQGASGLLMMAGDLPQVCAAALGQVLHAATQADLVLVPDRHHRGTNALLCTPAAAIRPCFGEDSMRRHLAAARQCGLRTRLLQLDELALDIDDAADLVELQRRTQPSPVPHLPQPLRAAPAI